MRRFLFQFYWKFERLITPGLVFSQHIYENVVKSLVGPCVEWLDVGCGHQILPPWRAEEEKRLATSCRRIVGLDSNFSALKGHANISQKVIGDISRLPFKDNLFDLVTANMVVEHLQSPEVQFREVARVLKPGGLFIFHTPNKRAYSTAMARGIPSRFKRKLIYLLDGRREQDVFETYYRANTAPEIHSLAQAGGFEVEKIRMLATSAASAMIPPLFILELLWIRLLLTERFKRLRTDMIAILRKR